MIYKIKLVDPCDKELIKQIQEQQDQEGIDELYNNLLNLGYTESYNKSRIYHIANLLEQNNMKFKVTQDKG